MPITTFFRNYYDFTTQTFLQTPHNPPSPLTLALKNIHNPCYRPWSVFMTKKLHPPPSSPQIHVLTQISPYMFPISLSLMSVDPNKRPAISPEIHFKVTCITLLYYKRILLDESNSYNISNITKYILHAPCSNHTKWYPPPLENRTYLLVTYIRLFYT